MAGAKKFSTEQELVMLREYVSAIEKRYQAVSRVVAILNTDLSLKESVRGVATVLQDLIPYDRFTLVLALMNREYEVEGGPFLSQQMEYRIIQASDSNASQWVLHNKRALLRKDISKEQRFEGDARRIQEGMYSDLVVPLMVVDEVVGTFSFTAQKANQFQETHLETAQSVADTIAVMFKQLQMRNSLGLKQAEVALRETERIQVLAETAGATAHEINQPLQVIMGMAQILQLEMGPETEQYQVLSDILESGIRISEIVKKMRVVRQYSTKPYAQGTQIIDFDTSSKKPE